MKADFIFATDVHGDFVKYDEHLSKNYRVSMDRYQEEHFRPVVINYDLDVVNTFRMLIHHLPVSATFLFYQCIDHPRTHAWYSTSRLGEKTLGSCLKVLHQEAGLGTDGVSNKTGRTTCISRMQAEGVPPKVGMKISGHKSEGAYKRYDRSTELLPSKAADSAESTLPSVIELEPTLQQIVEPVMQVAATEAVTAAVSVGLLAPTLEQGLSTLDDDVPTRFIEEQDNDLDVFFESMDWDALSCSDPRFKGIARLPNFTTVNPVINTVFEKIKALTNCTMNGCSFSLNFGPHGAGPSGGGDGRGPFSGLSLN